MPRQVYQTYGRHRQRVVALSDDIWENKDLSKPATRTTRGGIFSSFSSSGDTSVDSTGKGKQVTKNNSKKSRKQPANKENVFDDTASFVSKPRGRRAQNKTHIFDDSSDSQVGCRVLRDRNKCTYSTARKTTWTTKKLVSDTSSASPRETRRTARKKVTTTSRPAAHSTRARAGRQDDNARLDFSEFEKYSLCISGSPGVPEDVMVSPEIESALAAKGSTGSHKNAFTSTPHAEKEARIKCNLHKKLLIAEGALTNSNISHIEIPESPMELPSRVTRRGRKKVPVRDNSLLECIDKMEDIHLSTMSSIASSPSESSRNVSLDKSDSCSGKDEDDRLEIPAAPTEEKSISSGVTSSEGGSNKGSNPISSQYDASRSLFEHSHEPPPILSNYKLLSQNRDKVSSFVVIHSSDDSSSTEEDEIEEESEDEDFVPSDLSEIADEMSSLEAQVERARSQLDSISEEEEKDEGDEEEDEDSSHPELDVNDDASVNTHSHSASSHSKSGSSHKQHSGSSHSQFGSSCLNSGSKLSHSGNVSSSNADHTGGEGAMEASVESHTSQSYHTCPSIQYKTPNANRVRQLVNEDSTNIRQSLCVFLTPVRIPNTTKLVTPRDKLLTLCDQTDFISFRECIPPVMMKKCKKIGEGVYGEVFRTERNRQSVALKVIPIEGDFPVNDEQQKTFEEILPEIVISKELSALRESEDFMTENFVQVRDVSVVKGSYPDALLKQWDIFHKKKISENDRPDIFGEEQLFIVFEFEDCGSDLESIQLNSLQQAKSILHQVTCALAIAEEGLKFEHRDLHWGNVLVKTTKDELLDFTLSGQDFQVESQGVKVAIIDFTLSRLCKDGCNVFTDLSVDPTLFEGQGDYQFEVYRLMREENGNNWGDHHPYTNVLWIHYLADKLIQGKSYTIHSGREHQSLHRQFRTFIRQATDYNSALHLLADCPFFKDCVVKE